MQPTELLALMAAIIYRERKAKAGKQQTEELQAAAVAEAWQLSNLTLEHWTDSGTRQFHEVDRPA